jgi:hypothetical protein
MAKQKKFFEFGIIEQNGDQEYSTKHGLWDTTYNKALKRAKAYAIRYYDSFNFPPKVVRGEKSCIIKYCFDNDIYVALEYLDEIDVEEFKKNLFELAVIER